MAAALIAGAGLGAVSAGLGIFSSISGAKAAKRAARAAANRSIENGRRDARAMRLDSSMRIAQMVNSVAKAGVTSDGSPMDAINQNRNFLERQALDIEQAAQDEAYAIKQGAAGAATAGVLGAVGAGLQGVQTGLSIFGALNPPSPAGAQ